MGLLLHAICMHISPYCYVAAKPHGAPVAHNRRTRDRTRLPSLPQQRSRASSSQGPHACISTTGSRWLCGMRYPMASCPGTNAPPGGPCPCFAADDALVSYPGLLAVHLCRRRRDRMRVLMLLASRSSWGASALRTKVMGAMFAILRVGVVRCRRRAGRYSGCSDLHAKLERGREADPGAGPVERGRISRVRAEGASVCIERNAFGFGICVAV